MLHVEMEKCKLQNHVIFELIIMVKMDFVQNLVNLLSNFVEIINKKEQKSVTMGN